MKRTQFPQQTDHLDLVPLIDCIFLILLFFMLVGRLSDRTTEQITLAPGRTAKSITSVTGWSRELITIGDHIRIGTLHIPRDADLTPVRALLDRIYDQSPHLRDPLTGTYVPAVTMEIRAGADVPHGAVQAIEQLLTDSIDPRTRQAHRSVRPFVHIDFTVSDGNLHHSTPGTL